MRKGWCAPAVVAGPHPAGGTVSTAPNDVWCIDFKGWFRTSDGERCDPLTVSDANSRYLLACVIVPPRTEEVRPIREQLFTRHGLPLAMRSDNGAPFAGTGAGGLSRLSVGWVKAGIALERIEPGQLRQNGGHERIHRTLKAETARTTTTTAPMRRLANDRPRRSGAPRRRPAPNPWPRPGTTLGTRCAGCAPTAPSSGGERVFISETFTGETGGVGETDSGDWILRVADIDLGIIDRRTRKLRGFRAARPGRAEAKQTMNTVTHGTGP